MVNFQFIFIIFHLYCYDIERGEYLRLWKEIEDSQESIISVQYVSCLLLLWMLFCYYTCSFWVLMSSTLYLSFEFLFNVCQMSSMICK